MIRHYSQPLFSGCNLFRRLFVKRPRVLMARGESKSPVFRQELVITWDLSAAVAAAVRNCIRQTHMVIRKQGGQNISRYPPFPAVIFSCRSADFSSIQTILLVTESHRVSRKRRVADSDSLQSISSVSLIPPVGNCTLPRKTVQIMYDKTICFQPTLNWNFLFSVSFSIVSISAPSLRSFSGKSSYPRSI